MEVTCVCVCTYSQLYRRFSSILRVKQVAPLRQYHAAYDGGHVYVGNVMFGLAEGGGGLGFGVFRLEHASENRTDTWRRVLNIFKTNPSRPVQLGSGPRNLIKPNLFFCQGEKSIAASPGDFTPLAPVKISPKTWTFEGSRG